MKRLARLALAATAALAASAAALPAPAAGTDSPAYGPPVAVTYYYAPYFEGRAAAPIGPPSAYYYGRSPAPEEYRYVPPGLSIETPLGLYAPFYGGYSPYSAPQVGGYDHYRLTPDR